MNHRACRRIGALAIAGYLLAPLGAACAADKPDDNGFLKPRIEIMASVKTIGVMPLEVDETVPEPATVSDHYEAEVVTRLEQAGFAVVVPSVMRTIQERIERTLGGVYDPVTGRPETERAKAVREYERNEYLATQKVDALLWIGVVERRASTKYLLAEWDGVQDPYTGKSGFGADLAADFGDNYVGTLRALSLGVTLSDAYGTPIYQRYGGLQLLEYAPIVVTPQRVSRGVPNAILTDPARDQRALSRALDPLTLGKPSTTAAKLPLGPVARRPYRPALSMGLRVFRKRYHTLALAPLELPEMARHADVQAEYHALLAQRLRQLGYAVAGEENYAELWSAEVAAAGGFFDRYTGRVDRERLAAARHHVFDALREKFGIDAVVQPVIELRTATFRYLGATWDGAHQFLAKKGTLGGALDPSMNYVGTIPALTLVVRITNAAEEVVYEDVGGIQVAAQLDNGQVVDMPEGRILTDKTRNATAVDLALHALVPPPSDF